MIQVKQKVRDICDEVYKHGFQQIVIDLVQDDVEELLEDADLIRDDLIAQSYCISLLLNIFDEKFEKDIDLLTRLKDALDDWAHEYELVNKSLGLPPEK